MARKSNIARQAKREKLVALKLEKRKELKKVMLDQNASFEDKEKAMHALEKLPRNSAPVRLRNRCLLTGRPRGNYRKFGISRIKFREFAHEGLIPGVTKSSW